MPKQLISYLASKFKKEYNLSYGSIYEHQYHENETKIPISSREFSNFNLTSLDIDFIFVRRKSVNIEAFGGISRKLKVANSVLLNDEVKKLNDMISLEKKKSDSVNGSKLIQK